MKSKLLNKLNNKCTLPRFHINSCSLSETIEDFEYLLNLTTIGFNVIAISETRIVKGKTPVKSLKLINCIMNFVVLNHQLKFILNHLSYKPQHDVCIYNATELQSSFFEISNPKRPNIIIGGIYKHQNMVLDEFNDNYLNILLDKLSKENKSVFRLGHFNVDLLKYKHAPANEFLDSLSSHMFLPYIVQPTRISTNSSSNFY